ncbi:MYXO-CTERM sorting domain-containing protein [Nannocystis punicea]|uniref:MYXO-CTERM sorting domain-containing protein n=1 Tax=Nannocystis punicea TaxID=2995304 RepID=A0ABY7HAS4_9BACT|nr:MYXO-CTERM sorting domain-containing protein [Nannocystis poenicansa]WAS96228.1 MYXO-CTERM sorting domain-containing protein [Nannocystis poenicansa]
MVTSAGSWTPRACLLAIACLGSLGCRAANSEDGALYLSLRPLFYSEVHEPSGLRALQGSRACFEIRSHAEPGDETLQVEDLGGCYEMAMAGEPIAPGGCVVLDQLGAVQVDATYLGDCLFEGERELASDRFRIEVVPVDGLRAGLQWHMEEWAEQWLERLSTPPADLIPAVDEPLRLVPDVEVGFPIHLLDPAGRRVAWDLSQGRVLEAKDGGAPRQLVPVEDTAEFWPVRVGAGERSTLTLEVGGAVLPVAEVVATPVEEAASIEIVAGYFGEPLAARAVVRDGEGRVIVGAPVEWSLVEGELALEPFAGFVPPEYTMIEDACVPPPSAPESRRAVLRARLGALSDELELEWTATPPETTRDEPFKPDPACQRGMGPAEDDGPGAGDEGPGDRGCSCATGPDAGRDGWAWLGGMVLLLGGRRRRAHLESTASVSSDMSNQTCPMR